MLGQPPFKVCRFFDSFADTVRRRNIPSNPKQRGVEPNRYLIPALDTEPAMAVPWRSLLVSLMLSLLMVRRVQRWKSGAWREGGHAT